MPPANFLRIQFSMQKQQSGARFSGPRIALAVGALGFLLSLGLALTMLLEHGNPGFLLIWIVAAGATTACMRVHAKWRKSFERMYGDNPVRVFYPALRACRNDVEDVAFRDLPA